MLIRKCIKIILSSLADNLAKKKKIWVEQLCSAEAAKSLDSAIAFVRGDKQ